MGPDPFGKTEHPWCSRQALSPGQGQKRRLLLLWSAPAIPGGSVSLSPKPVLFLPQESGFLGHASRELIPVPVCPSSQEIVRSSGLWLHLQLSLMPRCGSRTQPSPGVSSAGAGMRSLGGKNTSDIPGWSELLKDVATLGLVSWAAKSPRAAPEGSGTSGTSVWSDPGQLHAGRSHL